MQPDFVVCGNAPGTQFSHFAQYGKTASRATHSCYGIQSGFHAFGVSIVGVVYNGVAVCLFAGKSAMGEGGA